MTREFTLHHKTRVAFVAGSSGFIGGHLVKRLMAEGYFVIGADIQKPLYTEPHLFYPYDLRVQNLVGKIFAENSIHEVYQLAADMGGAGYIFSGENDANVMHNSAQINLNIAEQARLHDVEKLFYSSSACMYPQELQCERGYGSESLKDTYDAWGTKEFSLKESMAYPANPDSEYGWEKLFSERLFLAYHRNHGLNVRIARFHNIFGPEGTWKGGKEKAPAAICRKIAESKGEIEVWGDGEQTRSFLYVDECIDGIRKLMQSDFIGPVNIGSDEMVSINTLVEKVSLIADKYPVINYIDGPTGVRGRNSNNDLIFEKLGWKPTLPLNYGLEKTYHWIKQQIECQFP
jgi:GDP-D-mannose 3',5'-epimerase